MANRRIEVVGRCAVLLCSVVALTACQPVDRVVAPGVGGGGSAADEPLGAPDQRFPQTLGALLDHAGRVAQEWQDGAVPVEVAVQLEQGRWRSAEATYVAPDADRFFRFVASPEGVEQSRPTLATLSLQPIDEPSTARIPPVPQGVLDPAALLSAAAPALADCGIDPRSGRILYATGAPFAWDGSRWTQGLAWTVTVSDRKHLLVLDPVSGNATGSNACRPLS
ncbi:MAG: hypothetical protein ACRDYX_03620 [Egibacteraceae bacterium]